MSEATTETKRIAMIAFNGADAQDIIGPCEVFAAANALAPTFGFPTEKLYQIEIVSLEESLRISTLTEIFLEAHRHWRDTNVPIDTLLISGGDSTNVVTNPEQIAWIRETAARSRRVGSICTGAFLLAKAGLLDGRMAVTHWRFCDQLASAYPTVKVNPDPIYLRDGNIYTSAGVTAGIDLALALLEEDAGRKLALRVARELVMFMTRPGGQAQFSTLLEMHKEDETMLGDLRYWMLDHISEDLSVQRLADHMHMSPRNFARVFTRETGKTPARYVEQLRVETARRWLEESKASLERVARECGFGSADSMRRSFLRVLTVVPQDYRQRFHM